MNVEISKNELDGALSALGKLICRTAPLEAYRSVQIEGKEDRLIFRTANGSESLAFKVTAEIVEPLDGRPFRRFPDCGKVQPQQGADHFGGER